MPGDPNGAENMRSERDFDELRPLDTSIAESTASKVLSLQAATPSVGFVSIPPDAVDRLDRCQRRLVSYVEGFLEVQSTRQQCQNLVDHLKQMGRELEIDFWDEVERVLDAAEPLTMLDDLVLEEQQQLTEQFVDLLEQAQKHLSDAQADRSESLGKRGSAARKIRAVARSMDATVKELRSRCEREARNSLRELNSCVTWILTSKARRPAETRTEDGLDTVAKLAAEPAPPQERREVTTREPSQIAVSEPTQSADEKGGSK